jgi:tetratricopeptide (TPR) repeat protein
VSEDKTVLIKTAYSYYQKGDWDRAIEEYHKLADIDPKDLNVHNMMADIYAKKGDSQEALQQYDLVAQGYDQKNQVDKVMQVYKRMLKLVPNDVALSKAVKNLGDKYLARASEMEEQEAEKAAEIYRSILKAEPGRVDATQRYARLLTKMGRKFEAVEVLMNLAMGLDPETQAARLVEMLQLVTEIDPLNIEAREKLNEFLLAAKETMPAIKNLQDLIEIYISKNDFSGAEAAAKKAIQLGDSGAHYHLGVIYFNQQKYADSRTAFEIFLQLQEAHVGALKYLALTCLRLNQTADAVAAYLRILDVYFNENLLDEAKEVRRTILELDPQNTDVAKYALDPVPVAAAPPAEEEPAFPPTPAPIPAEAPARPDESSARPAIPAPGPEDEEKQKTMFAQAQGFVDKGFYEQAIDVYLEMLKLWPQLPDIRIRLQQVYALMARSMESAEKYPSPEEIKADLEKELREQMKRELEEQARVVQERHRELEMKREADQIKLKQELESKFMQQVQRTQEDDLRRQLMREFEEKQRLLAQEREKLEKEKAESLHLLKAQFEENRSSLEKKIREQVEREMREKLEQESREKESPEADQESVDNLKQQIREQVEKEMSEKREKESQLKAALVEEEEARRREEEDRLQYAEQKREQEEERAKINQEILQGMERLRMEKEKESKSAPRAPSLKAAKKDAPAAQESLDDPFIRQTLADIYAKQGLFLEALKIYERILIDEPNNEDVREKLRNILRLKGI